MITWLIVWVLLLCGLVTALAILRALGGIQEPQHTTSRVIVENAATSVLVAHSVYQDDGSEYIDGEAVKL